MEEKGPVDGSHSGWHHHRSQRYQRKGKEINEAQDTINDKTKKADDKVGKL